MEENANLRASHRWDENVQKFGSSVFFPSAAPLAMRDFRDGGRGSWMVWVEVSADTTAMTEGMGHWLDIDIEDQNQDLKFLIYAKQHIDEKLAEVLRNHHERSEGNPRSAWTDLEERLTLRISLFAINRQQEARERPGVLNCP
ncbi:hypothetical protein ONS95_001379 [Cadophora gregata]|uniref:uncharacterized protein n=1 Tax=Cadophora gregata TaxID=51156 RepID=UPI0026DDAC2C|nr:uncharacterized protein ONS95_001379 [Cadophora gregata]KAK0110999.1 hypothetical protein ONS95_001379 [Cadophora gregata]KAK0112543.1 hypothetical protein ONS96_001779 [Cadophora gregata f. sp. sojae]